MTVKTHTSATSTQAPQAAFNFSLATLLSELQRHRPTRSESAVFAFLAAFIANERDAYPTVAYIAGKIKPVLSTRTVKRALQSLKAKGLIEITRRRRVDGRQGSSLYAIASGLFGQSDKSKIQSDKMSLLVCGEGAKYAQRTIARASLKLNLKSHLSVAAKAHTPQTVATLAPDNGFEKKDGRTTATRLQSRKVNWGRTLSTADLRDGRKIFALFDLAVAQGFRHDTEGQKHQFARLALYCSEVGDTPGMFTRLVSEGEYDRGDDEHDVRAWELVKAARPGAARHARYDYFASDKPPEPLKPMSELMAERRLHYA